MQWDWNFSVVRPESHCKDFFWYSYRSTIDLLTTEITPVTRIPDLYVAHTRLGEWPAG